MTGVIKLTEVRDIIGAIKVLSYLLHLTAGLPKFTRKPGKGIYLGFIKIS